MHLDVWLAQRQAQALAIWQGLTPEDFYNLWLAGGVLWFGFLFWLSTRIMRKALGHVLFRGTWYNAAQWEVMIKMIDEDNQRGHRVMKHDEMNALRIWRFGSAKTISGGAKGYF
ncbi:MAG: hypothetical protein Q7T21_02870 [Gallionella sp.]|nr:hypothetical protein [Gallionella sp.]